MFMKKETLTPEDRWGYIIEKIEELRREKKLDEILIDEFISNIFIEGKTPSTQRLKALCENSLDTRCLSSIYPEILISLEDYKIRSGDLYTPLRAVNELMKMFEELVRENPENGNIGIAVAAGVYSRVQSLIRKMEKDPENRKYIVPSSLSGVSYTDIIGMPFLLHLEKALQLLNNQDLRWKAKAIYLLAKHAGWNTLAFYYIDKISKVEESKREPIIAILSNIYPHLDLLKEREDLDQKIRDVLLKRLQNLPEEHIKELAEYYQRNYGWKTKSVYRNPEVLIPLLHILEKTPPKEETFDILNRYSKDIREFYKLLENILGSRVHDAYKLDFIIDNYDLINRVILGPLFKQYRNSNFVRKILFEIFERILPYRHPLTEGEKKDLLSLLEKAEKIIPYIPRTDNIIERSRNTDLFSIETYLILDVFKYKKDIENFERHLDEVEMILDTAIKVAKKYELNKWTPDAKILYNDTIEAILYNDDLRKSEHYVIQILEDAGNKSKIVSEIQERLGIESGIWNRTLGPIYLLPPEELRNVLEKLLRNKGLRDAEGTLSSFLEKLNKKIEEDYNNGKLNKEIYELLDVFTSNDYWGVSLIRSALAKYYKLAYSHPEKRELIVNYVRDIIKANLEL